MFLHGCNSYISVDMRGLYRLLSHVVVLGTCLLIVAFVALNSRTNSHIIPVFPSVSAWQARVRDINRSAKSEEQNGSLGIQEQHWRDPEYSDGDFDREQDSDEKDAHLHVGPVLSRQSEPLHTEKRFGLNHIARPMEGLDQNKTLGALHSASTTANPNSGSNPPSDSLANHIIVMQKSAQPALATFTEDGPKAGEEATGSQPPSQEHNEQQRPTSQSFWKDPHAYVAEMIAREKLITATQGRSQSLQAQVVPVVRNDSHVYTSSRVAAQPSVNSNEDTAVRSPSLQAQVVPTTRQPQKPKKQSLVYTSSSEYSTPATAVRIQVGHPSSPPSSPLAEIGNKKHGYVLAVNYYEQQSMGSRNLLQLQCWAKSLGLSVVQPSMKDSVVLTPLSDKQQSKYLGFGDSFNLADWNRHTELFKYAPLVGMKTFLSQAPRNVILVNFEYASVSLIKLRQRAGESIIHEGKEEQYKNGCSSKWPKTSQLLYLKSKGFRIARTVCFNFYYGDQLTVEQFNSHLLGPLKADEVTVIMELWRGIGTAQRVLMYTDCRNAVPVQEHILPSDRLVQTAQMYIRRYLNDSPYLAILGRLEMSMITIHKKVPVIPFCLQETLSEWEAFVKESDLQNTFVALDIGKYGTKGFRYKEGLQHEAEVDTFLKGVYGSTMTLRGWEGTFEAVSPSWDTGYIALLQKVIVTRAKCVLFVGGGAFQRHALNLYRELHPDPQDQCLRVVEKCTSSAKFAL